MPRLDTIKTALQSTTRLCDHSAQIVNCGGKRIIQGKPINCLIVRRKPGKARNQGLICIGHRVIECRLGSNGISGRKREGDACTPPGRWRLLFGWHRHDRIRFPRSPLAFRRITGFDGWCDDPASSLYNRAVRLPFARSHETMMRKDRLYDVCIVLDYNERNGTLYATGTRGGEMFEQFFAEFGFRLALEHRTENIKERVSRVAVVVPLAEYCETQVLC